MLIPKWVEELTDSYEGDPFAQAQEKWVVRGGIHFTARGNQIVGKTLRRYHSRMETKTYKEDAWQVGTQECREHTKGQNGYFIGQKWRDMWLITSRGVKCASWINMKTCHHLGCYNLLPYQKTIGPGIFLRAGGKDFIKVVVNRLSKYSHFIPLSHAFTAPDVARLFLDHI